MRTTNMKFILLFFTLLVISTVSAQTNFPGFLEGTWKVENKDLYEHWDRLNENSLKGFSYILKNGQMTVSEYLSVSRIGNEIIYTAAVLSQNHGKEINFKLSKTENTYTFENPDHDFPKRIVYQKLSDTEISVQATGGGHEGFAYTMKKQITTETEKDTSIANPEYDPELAKKLGADDYGMKSYVLVMLKTGPNQTADRTLISDRSRGHLDNISRLVEQGKLVVAGPLGKNDKTYRGIFILNVSTLEEAESLLQTDPAIKEGLLDAELYNWYGSAALPEYLEFSDKVWKVQP